ncbi:MAG: hypothetical protein KIT43_06225 [Bauldia sp.]|nr:hypothetical protein [Bauldia sp.]MCW5717217.1 hypothetical protein [Bauldia sp.]
MDLIDPGFWNDWGEGITVLLLAALIVFAIFIAYRGYRISVSARTALASQESYRALAEQVSAALKATADQRQAEGAALSEIEKRLGAIERLLRQVG